MVAQLDKLYLRTRFWKLWSRLVSYVLFEGRPLTTKGRWFNKFVFLNLWMQKNLPAFRQVRKPIFIIGIGRSGTTILGKLMSMHHQVGYLNEPKAMWHTINPNEDLVGNYSLNDASYRIQPEELSEHDITKAHRLYGNYLVSSFSSRVVDKYPELIFRMPFVKRIFPDAKFIFLIRNGWDTCSSIEQWSNRLGNNSEGEVQDWWGIDNRKWKLLVNQLVPEHADLAPHRKDMLSWNIHSDMAAVEWIISMREGMTLVDKSPDDVLAVKYEDLCQYPRKELQRIIHFSQLNNSDEKFFEYGTEILKINRAKPEINLHPTILKPFLSTLSALGY